MPGKPPRRDVCRNAVQSEVGPRRWSDTAEAMRWRECGGGACAQMCPLCPLKVMRLLPRLLES